MTEMTQDEAMNMSNEQAVQILKPVMDMMRDQHGCPISDVYFAIEKAISVLTTISPDDVLGGTWVGIDDFPHESWECDRCGCVVENTDDPWNYFHYCPNCGAKMEVSG